jgi:hypothetical protein
MAFALTKGVRASSASRWKEKKEMLPQPATENILVEQEAAENAEIPYGRTRLRDLCVLLFKR